MITLPLLLALSVGFTHAFEADHLIAVSTIVTRRRQGIWSALKEGVYWGLGHTSTILLVGSLFIFGRFALMEDDFRYFEAGVGLMLVVLGTTRLYKLWRQHTKLQLSTVPSYSHADANPSHGLSYVVGFIHGLAGSGALILTVLTQVPGTGAGLLYLIIFGIGSIAGMMVAAGVFSLPFLTRSTNNQSFRTILIILSSVLCIFLGLKVFWENM